VSMSRFGRAGLLLSVVGAGGGEIGWAAAVVVTCGGGAERFAGTGKNRATCDSSETSIDASAFAVKLTIFGAKCGASILT
jgi:hypothetical protein